MKITYDLDANAVQIILRTGRAFEDSIELEEGVTADLDGDGHVVGIEILDARERLGPDPLACVSIERYPMPTPQGKGRNAKARS